MGQLNDVIPRIISAEDTGVIEVSARINLKFLGIFFVSLESLIRSVARLFASDFGSFNFSNLDLILRLSSQFAVAML